MNKKYKEIETFVLIRDEDVSGVSGTRVVAEGVKFSYGKCVIAWVTKHRSIAIHDSLDEVIAIHCRDGKTRISWEQEYQC